MVRLVRARRMVRYQTPHWRYPLPEYKSELSTSAKTTVPKKSNDGDGDRRSVERDRRQGRGEQGHRLSQERGRR